MKYLKDYRDADRVKVLLEKLHTLITQNWTLMEVCGGQTHSLVKNGLLDLFPEKLRMVHGPGCPVCVTPLHLIDKAVELALEGVTVFSFGDMLRVPGSKMSLLSAKAEGGDVRIVYSPLEAVKFAAENPDLDVVFFAVGFETTAPANALSVLHAQRAGLKNYSILTSHVLVPPAIDAVMNDPDGLIQGFLAAGHVCTIMGLSEYEPLVKRHGIPIVVTGFEPVDLVQGIYLAVKQLEEGKAELQNQYSRVVRPEGNPDAQRILKEVFRVSDREWRGIGNIPGSGYELREELEVFDADKKYNLSEAKKAEECSNCIAGLVLKGQKKPFECSEFGKGCTPRMPLGAPMVSSEGACAAYYHYHQAEVAV